MGVAMVEVSCKMTVLLILWFARVEAYGNIVGMMLERAKNEIRQVDWVMAELNRMRGQDHSPEPWHYNLFTQTGPATNAMMAKRAFDASARILSDLTVWQVQLISQRNGPQGELIDHILTLIEEKSYQLKTMLIQLTHDKNVAVSYFPGESHQIFGQIPSPGVVPQYRPYTYG